MKKQILLGFIIAVLIISVIAGVCIAKNGNNKNKEVANTRQDKDVKDNMEETTQEETTQEETTQEETTQEQFLDTDKVVYLTFDDGPSDLTPQFIDTLNQYGVHGTFFVTYQEGRENIYKSIIENGNKIQIHTATHDYDAIYQSVQAYVADFEQIYNYVKEITGVECDVFRFPGGSNNSYGGDIAPDIAREMRNRGFNYVDWNSSVGDGSASATKDSEIQKVMAECDGVKRVVLLAHDSGAKSETLAALPQIIEYFQNNGYKFGLINGEMVSDFQFMKID